MTPAWDEKIRQLVQGLRRIAVHRDHYSYYPDGGFGEPFNYPSSGWQKTDEPTTETEGGEGSVVAYHGHQIQALTRWYALSGDEEALDLAARVARFCMLPKFWGGLPNPDGEIGGSGLDSQTAAGCGGCGPFRDGALVQPLPRPCRRAARCARVRDDGGRSARRWNLCGGLMNTAGPWESPASGGSTATRRPRICARVARWETWSPWGFD